MTIKRRWERELAGVAKHGQAVAPLKPHDRGEWGVEQLGRLRRDKIRKTSLVEMSICARARDRAHRALETGPRDRLGNVFEDRRSAGGAAVAAGERRHRRDHADEAPVAAAQHPLDGVRPLGVGEIIRSLVDREGIGGSVSNQLVGGETGHRAQRGVDRGDRTRVVEHDEPVMKGCHHRGPLSEQGLRFGVGERRRDELREAHQPVLAHRIERPRRIAAPRSGSPTGVRGCAPAHR